MDWKLIYHDNFSAFKRYSHSFQMCINILHTSKRWLLVDSAAKPLHTLCSIAPHTSPQTSNPLVTLPDSGRNLRKRKRSSIEDDEYLWECDDVNGYLPDEEALTQPKKRKAEVPPVRMTCIRPPSFVYPKTAYSGHLPSLPTYAEKRVLQDILVGWIEGTPHILFES